MLQMQLASSWGHGVLAITYSLLLPRARSANRRLNRRERKYIHSGRRTSRIAREDPQSSRSRVVSRPGEMSHQLRTLLTGRACAGQRACSWSIIRPISDQRCVVHASTTRLHERVTCNSRRGAVANGQVKQPVARPCCQKVSRQKRLVLKQVR
ncbi:uncharacterized protein B0H18DRAFT_999733 [Fomitopsis serialis]|uniref:uncharacterized protein n=1 Tax=Fomitopsis serialis TaxID=139415 RepID=UPI0020085BC2|nr:uncharacterized protein B0H18DRAFT_999733 [Neoantrodia serialis]KAH9928625.1 hypothetical protein B0H18DRAFT_999733 [Neoantrodia serialis]